MKESSRTPAETQRSMRESTMHNPSAQSGLRNQTRPRDGRLWAEGGRAPEQGHGGGGAPLRPNVGGLGTSPHPRPPPPMATPSVAWGFQSRPPKPDRVWSRPGQKARRQRWGWGGRGPTPVGGGSLAQTQHTEAPLCHAPWGSLRPHRGSDRAPGPCGGHAQTTLSPRPAHTQPGQTPLCRELGLILPQGMPPRLATLRWSFPSRASTRRTHKAGTRTRWV